MARQRSESTPILLNVTFVLHVDEHVRLIFIPTSDLQIEFKLSRDEWQPFLRCLRRIRGAKPHQRISRLLTGFSFDQGRSLYTGAYYDPKSRARQQRLLSEIMNDPTLVRLPSRERKEDHRQDRFQQQTGLTSWVHLEKDGYRIELSREHFLKVKVACLDRKPTVIRNGKLISG
jgi:hypothetical protein